VPRVVRGQLTERGLPVARSYREVVTCDLDDGEVAATDSVTFTYGGRTYGLDVCRKHVEEVKAIFERLTKAGHVVSRRGRGARGGATGRGTRGRTTAAAGRSSGAGRSTARRGESLAEIRQWARAEGYAVGDRGRIPAEIRTAYEAAHGRRRRG
jgi:hypothetical protein